MLLGVRVSILAGQIFLILQPHDLRVCLTIAPEMLPPVPRCQS